MNLSIKYNLFCPTFDFIIEKYLKEYINTICGPIAQLVEQFPFKEWVGGSSPPGLTKLTSFINRWIF